MKRPAAGARCSSPRRSSSCSSWAPRTASSRAGCCRSTRCCACSPRGRRSRPPRACGRAAPGPWPRSPRCCACRAWSSRSTTTSCWRAHDTRALARAWMVDNIPEGDRVVIEPIAPDQWAMDTGRPSSATGTGNRWNKWPTSRFRGQVGQARGLRAHPAHQPARPLRARRLLPRRHGLDPVRPRADRAGARCRRRSAYYDELERRADVVYRVSPRGDEPGRPLLVRLLVQQLSARLQRPGPEIVIRRLRDC